MRISEIIVNPADRTFDTIKGGISQLVLDIVDSVNTASDNERLSADVAFDSSELRRITHATTQLYSMAADTFYPESHTIHLLNQLISYLMA